MDYLPHIDRPHFDPAATERLLLQMGYALAMVQDLELALSTYLSVVVDIEPGTAVDIAVRTFENNEKKTLGRLLNDLRKSDQVPEDLVSKIEALRPERNWLAHRGNHAGREVLNKPMQLAEVLARMLSLADNALKLAKTVSAELDRFQIQQGVSRDELDRLTCEIAAKWENT